MVVVVGVRFKEQGKMYYFAPGDLEIKEGDGVIVETARGMEYAVCSMGRTEVSDSNVVKPLKGIVRIANDDDKKRHEQNESKKAEAMRLCQEKVDKHGLEMKLIDVEYTFDNNKIVFYFTADGRVDFRELVKDLASVFHMRIELRQIGVRDEAKMIGGMGICGRPFCCSSFLGSFQTVSIKVAKEQGLSLNPGKISGTCGKLMCCLRYEQQAYDYLLKITPKPGATVQTEEGQGTVTEMSLLTGKLKVQLDSNPNGIPKTFDRDEVKLIKDVQIKLNKEEIDALKDIEE